AQLILAGASFHQGAGGPPAADAATNAATAPKVMGLADQDGYTWTFPLSEPVILRKGTFAIAYTMTAKMPDGATVVVFDQKNNAVIPTTPSSSVAAAATFTVTPALSAGSYDLDVRVVDASKKLVVPLQSQKVKVYVPSAQNPEISELSN